MNAYYSNLIEGHNTRPREIERALTGQLDADRARRNLQLEAAAHVRVQEHVDRCGSPPVQLHPPFPGREWSCLSADEPRDGTACRDRSPGLVVNLSWSRSWAVQAQRVQGDDGSRRHAAARRPRWAWQPVSKSSH